SSPGAPCTSTGMLEEDELVESIEAGDRNVPTPPFFWGGDVLIARRSLHFDRNARGRRTGGEHRSWGQECPHPTFFLGGRCPHRPALPALRQECSRKTNWWRASKLG